jgi:hypothetical protein
MVMTISATRFAAGKPARHFQCTAWRPVQGAFETVHQGSVVAHDGVLVGMKCLKLLTPFLTSVPCHFTDSSHQVMATWP